MNVLPAALTTNRTERHHETIDSVRGVFACGLRRWRRGRRKRLVRLERDLGWSRNVGRQSLRCFWRSSAKYRRAFHYQSERREYLSQKPWEQLLGSREHGEQRRHVCGKLANAFSGDVLERRIWDRDGANRLCSNRGRLGSYSVRVWGHLLRPLQDNSNRVRLASVITPGPSPRGAS